MSKKPEWLREFERVGGNPVYFLELYYNVVHPDKVVSLSDEEKQEYFDQFKRIPVFEWGVNPGYIKCAERIKQLKDEGYRDWEIF